MTFAMKILLIVDDNIDLLYLRHVIHPLAHALTYL
jgi:hypothetical protein